MIVNSKIILARKHFYDDDGAVHLVNPIIDMQVPFLPTTISFSIFASIVISGLDHSYAAKVEITDKENNVILSINGPLNSPGVAERGLLQLNINAEDVIFKNEGKHICKLIFNDELIYEYDFEVYNKKIEIK